MTVPYTYLLRHKPTNTFYYGVRYAKNCHPSEFWKKYFTTSRKMVPLLRTLFGDETFDFEIRKIFKTAEQAVKWETKVLRRIKVLENTDTWLNRGNNKGIINLISPTLGRIVPEAQKAIQRLKMSGRKASDETRKLQSNNNTGARNPMFGKSRHDLAKLNKERKWTNEQRTKVAENNSKRSSEITSRITKSRLATMAIRKLAKS